MIHDTRFERIMIKMIITVRKYNDHEHRVTCIVAVSGDVTALIY